MKPWPFVLAGALWLLALAPFALGAPPGARAGLLAGWWTGGASGILSLGFLAFASRRKLKTFMMSLLGGFFLRLLLVSGGLFLAVRHGDSARWFCVSFFALYWIFLCCEFFAVRTPAAPRAALGSEALS